MKKRFLLLCAMLGIGCLTSFAQMRYPAEVAPDGLSKDLVTPMMWTDNTTLLLSNGNFRSMEVLAENIKTGVRTKAEMPKRLEEKVNYTVDKDAKNATLSPDGLHVAYTLNNNLYSKEIATGKITQYTFDGSETILNGWASWVYYEEILGRAGRYRSFWWSPDSSRLVFFRCDDSQVPMFPIYVSEGHHGYIERTRYPKAGDQNPEVKIGLVTVGNSQIVWADFNEKDDQYFGQPYWTPDGSKVWLQWMNRDQNNLKLYAVDPANGSKDLVYEEKQEAWLDWITGPVFMDEGLMMIRDFEKWQQVYICPWDGSGIKCVTTGKNWGLSIIGVDKKTNTLFYNARAEISTRSDVYSVVLPSKKNTKAPSPKRLTQGDYNFSGAVFSPDFQHFAVSYSNVSTPTRTALYSVKKGFLRDLGDSKGPGYDEALAKGEIPVTEMHFITTEDGFTIPATITWPLNMEEGKQYPCIVSIYGGPDAGSVMDRFSAPARNYQWAKNGVIQISMDHRGSGHCGKKGLDAMHKNLGKWEMHDYKLWIDYLRKTGHLNPNKVGITGYSYGGYVTALAVITEGDYFQYGIAGAGVYDWALYDTHYAERFMLRPQDNPEGYKRGSVVENTAQYGNFGKESVLLITHGTSDDNVHFQNSVQLVNVLMKNDKHFEYMLYPSERHGYRGYKSVFSSSEERAFWMRYLLDK